MGAEENRMETEVDSRISGRHRRIWVDRREGELGIETVGDEDFSPAREMGWAGSG